MEYRKQEVRAGVFIVVAVVIALVLLFSVSDLQGLFKHHKEYRVLFSSNEGLEKNATVRYSGIRIGRVTGMRVMPELGGKVELAIDIYDDAVIKEDVKASIRTLGLVGKKYVDLSGGSPGARDLAPGAVITGEDALKLEDLTKAGMEVVHRLQSIAANLDRIIGDPAMAQSIKTTLRNLQDTSAGIRTLATTSVPVIVQNVQDTTENIKTMTSSKEALAQGLQRLPEILKKIDDVTANLKAVSDKADKLVGENRKNFDDSLANIKQMTQNLKDITEDVKSNPWKLIRKP